MGALVLPDSIDWSAFEACYGPPDEIPGLILAAVADGRGMGSNGALSDLSNDLCHQFTVVPAAEAAVPVLAALATEVDFPMRSDLIVILGYCAQPRERWVTARTRVAPTVDDPIRLAGRGSLPALVQVADIDARVRPDVAAVASGFPEEAARTLGALRSWLAHAPAGPERVPIALAIAVLGDRDEIVITTVSRPPDEWPLDLHGPVLDWVLGRATDREPPTRFTTAHAVLEAAWSRHL